MFKYLINGVPTFKKLPEAKLEILQLNVLPLNYPPKARDFESETLDFACLLVSIIHKERQ